MTDYPLRGGVGIQGLQVAGVYHAGKRIGLAHAGTMLVPSGKNLLRYGAATTVGGRMAASIMADGGLRVETAATVPSWNGFQWRTDILSSDLHEGDVLTASLADYDRLNKLCFQIFFDDESGKFLQRITFTSDNMTPRTITVPAGAVVFRACVFTYGAQAESSVAILHPQLERGSERTCWEPPAILAGGGQPKRP